MGERKTATPGATSETAVTKKTAESVQIHESMHALIARISSEESGIAEKLQSEHFTQYLAITEKNVELGWQDQDRERQDRKHQRWMTLLYVVLGIVVFLAVLVLFREVFSKDAVMLERFLIAVGGLVAGGAGGYGLGRWKKSE